MNTGTQTVFALLEGHERHDNPAHIENSRRLTAVTEGLSSSGLVKNLRRVPCPVASDEVLELVHTPRHVAMVREFSEAGGGWFDPDTYTTLASDEVAREAVGGLLDVTRAVVTGEAQNGMAIVRPPGHHAVPEGVMGFCLFNSVAVAARWAQREFGIRKIAIVDFDVHHGNGTQDAFYDDPDVLFLSIHQHPFYPGTGRISETGKGKGEHTTVNAPVPAGSGDSVFAEVFERVFTPAVERFEPELILLSAGFDAHFRDPIGGCAVSVEGFGGLTSSVMDWAAKFAGGKLVATLEGGYDAAVLAACVHNTLALLSGNPGEVEDPFGRSPTAEPNISELIKKLTELHGID